MHSPTHQVQYKKPGASCYDFWFPVSCEKTSSPHPSTPYTHTKTLMNSAAHHTLDRAGLGSVVYSRLRVCWVGFWNMHYYLIRVRQTLSHILYLITPTVTMSWSVLHCCKLQQPCEEAIKLYKVTTAVPPPAFNLFLFSLYIPLFYLLCVEDASVSRDHWNSNNRALCVLVCELEAAHLTKTSKWEISQFVMHSLLPPTQTDPLSAKIPEHLL